MGLLQGAEQRKRRGKRHGRQGRRLSPSLPSRLLRDEQEDVGMTGSETAEREGTHG